MLILEENSLSEMMRGIVRELQVLRSSCLGINLHRLSAVYSGHFRDGDKLANILLEDG
jgi:hypothetical protein